MICQECQQPREFLMMVDGDGFHIFRGLSGEARAFSSIYRFHVLHGLSPASSPTPSQTLPCSFPLHLLQMHTSATLHLRLWPDTRNTMHVRGETNDASCSDVVRCGVACGSSGVDFGMCRSWKSTSKSSSSTTPSLASFPSPPGRACLQWHGRCGDWRSSGRWWSPWGPLS